MDYKYDVFGNRIEKDVDRNGDGVFESITRYALDGSEVWADLDGKNNNALLTRYVHGDQTDQLLARVDGLGAAWYLTDHLGSVRDVLDNTGAVNGTLNYDA